MKQIDQLQCAFVWNLRFCGLYIVDNNVQTMVAVTLNYCKDQHQQFRWLRSINYILILCISLGKYYTTQIHVKGLWE